MKRLLQVSSLQFNKNKGNKSITKNNFTWKNSTSNNNSFSPSLFRNERRFLSTTVKELPKIEIPSTDFIKRGPEREKEDYEIGDRVEGYLLLDKFEIERRKWKVYKFEHEKTGAEHVHISTDDTNNVFSVLLKTTPMNNSGVAHILEHTSLCGSLRYPVRDPFFNMIKRSLNTYMNAWTGGDFTAYPFSTCNAKDYFNLLSVYLDATFFPLLTENDFKQEGWRLHYDLEKGKLEYKGVVYNEMKGAMSDQSSIIDQEIQSNLFTPKLTYHFNSGGDPSEIPSLSYSQLKKFHANFYHPSNSRFFTFGDLPMKMILKSIDEIGLRFFERNKFIGGESEVKNDLSFEEVKIVRKTFPPNPSLPLSHSFSGSMTYVMNEVTDNYHTFLLHFLSELLLAGPTSAFFKARMAEGNFGLDYSSSSGYHANTKQTFFTIGMDGLSEDELKKFFQMVDRTLLRLSLPYLPSSSSLPSSREKCAVKVGGDSEEDKYIRVTAGLIADINVKEEEENPIHSSDTFSPENINALLHQIELSQKNISSNYGLNVFSGMISSWLHGGNIKEMIDLDINISRLKKDLSAHPNFFSHLVDKFFIQNTHKLRMEFEPDENYLNVISKKEEEKLAEINRHLNQRDIDQLLASSIELDLHQSSPQRVEELPRVEVKDVPRHLEKQKFDIVNTKKGISLQTSEQITNEISYLKLILNINELNDDLARFIPLFCDCFSKMGTQSTDYSNLSRKIKSFTGGFNASSFSHSFFRGEEGGEEERGILINSMALNPNLKSMFDLFEEILFKSTYTNTQRFFTLLSSATAEMGEGVVGEGHRFALSLAKSKLTNENYYNEMWNGISYLKLLQRYVNDPSSHLSLLSSLHEIGKFLTEKGRGRMSVITTADAMNDAISLSHHFSSLLPSPSLSPLKRVVDENEEKEHLNYVKIRSNVNFIGRSIRSADIFSDDYPKLFVLCNIISHNYLHNEVREKGGAYGSGVNPSNKLLNFYSYRDPNFEKTIETFKNTLNWVRNHSFTDQMIEEAKLMVFQAFDVPKVPAEEGQHHFLTGLTHEKRQRNRDILFNVDKSQLLEMAEKYFGNESKSESIAVFGSEETKIPSSFTVDHIDVSSPQAEECEEDEGEEGDENEHEGEENPRFTRTF